MTALCAAGVERATITRITQIKRANFLIAITKNIDLQKELLRKGKLLSSGHENC